ncbi:MAG: T9SS type A sorting domain-containing protein [Ignavibacteria bacterium]|nr:T9SS type A sorting domain-containing protein [Ignavibacteria bacterium]
MRNKLTLLLITILFSAASLTGQDKKVLFEEFTNASCAPCASNNPALKEYIDSKGDTIVAVKYHTNFPGFDPMYNLNPSQVEERRGGYYSDVNAVPWLKGDGNMFPDIWPFTLSNFDAAFNTRKAVVPLLTISVSDSRIAGDTIKSVVSINIPQDLPSGNYKLRVMAVEKVIIYPTPPGNNGERIFEHVFRKGIPDMEGTIMPAASGNYQFIFKYKIEPEWIDTSMNTIAFVQNDGAGNKEVLNCALGENIPTGISVNSNTIPERFTLYQNYPNPFNPSTGIKFDVPKNSIVKLSVYNSLGQEAAVLLNETLSAGTYNMRFDGANLSSGLYFYKIETEDFTDIKKMMLVK